MPDYDLVVIEMEFHTCYCLHFQTNKFEKKGMNSLTGMDFKLLLIILLKDAFGIKSPTNIDII